MGEKIATRHAYGNVLAEIGDDKRIVVLDADVSTCTMSCIFAEKYPERFFNVGIAEANMVGIAAGLTTMGYIPFIHSFAMFTAGRCFDQIRNTLAYPNLNVKVVGTHAGLSVGEDGATHQCLEDMGIMRTIPNMTIIHPCDGHETNHAVKALLKHVGPSYLRIGRAALDIVTDFEDYTYEIGRAIRLREGNDVTIVAVGMMVQEALKAADALKNEISVRVLNMHTIKPIDETAIIIAAKETGAIVTVEEHNILGGLGGAVAEVTSRYCPIPVIRMGTHDTFGRSGNVDKLMLLYRLTMDDIIKRVREIIMLK